MQQCLILSHLIYLILYITDWQKSPGADQADDLAGGRDPRPGVDLPGDRGVHYPQGDYHIPC